MLFKASDKKEPRSELESTAKCSRCAVRTEQCAFGGVSVCNYLLAHAKQQRKKNASKGCDHTNGMPPQKYYFKNP